MNEKYFKLKIKSPDTGELPLTLNEQRLVLASVGRQDGRMGGALVAWQDFSVPAEGFVGAFNISIDKAYEYLKDVAEVLYGRTITKIEG